VQPVLCQAQQRQRLQVLEKRRRAAAAACVEFPTEEGTQY